MSKISTLLFVATAALLFATTAIPGTDAVCEHFGKKCDEASPCCFNGYCDSQPRFCAEGCDPANSFSEKSCYPRPACVNFETNFGDAEKLIVAEDYDANPNNYDFYSNFQPNYASITGGELKLDMKYNGNERNEVGNYEGFGATVTWTRLIEYGKVTAVVRSASLSPGVVSSFITRSPEGDEIDFEWVGKNPTEVESNFYYNNELDWTKGGHHNVGGDTSQEYHEYAIEWMPDTIVWWINGRAVRTVRKTETERMPDGTYKFPNKLSNVQFSIWDGGMKAEGTAQWAGTPTDWSDPERVYSMYVRSLKVECLYPNATGEWPPEGFGPTKKSSDDSDDDGDDDGDGVPNKDDDDHKSGGGSGSSSAAAIALNGAITLAAAGITSLVSSFLF